LTITLLSDIGTSVDVHTMDHELLDQAIDWLRPSGTA
jgi:3-dehydroquinate synthase